MMPEISGKFVDVELVSPEFFEHRVVIGAKEAMALREQHAGAGMESVVDATRALDGQSLRVGEPPRVHVGVAHLAPEMRRAFFHRAHEFGNAQRIGQPLELHAHAVFDLEQPLVRDIGKRALVVGVDADTRAGHGCSLLGRLSLIPDIMGCLGGSGALPIQKIDLIEGTTRLIEEQHQPQAIGQIWFAGEICPWIWHGRYAHAANEAKARNRS